MNRAEWTRRVVLGGWALLASAAVLQLLPQFADADEASEEHGAALMDKYVQVTGGKAAYEAIKTRIVKAEAMMPGGGMTGKMEVYAAYPDKFRSTVDTQLGKIERGSDGKTVWISFPDAPPTILEGADRVSAIRESAQDRFGNWRKIYQKADYVGNEDVDGVTCAKVVLTLKPLDPNVDESPVTAYLAQDSGLIVQWATEMVTPVGNTGVVVRLSDYRKVGDVLIPHQMTAAAQGLEQSSATVSEIVFNKEIPAETFSLPDAVKEQLKSKEQAKSKTQLKSKERPKKK